MGITPIYFNEPSRNEIHDVADITVNSGEIEEPVTLQEMKDFMRIEGFESDNESGVMAFTSDDALIEELITSAREGLERWCGISIIRHRWQALFTNGIGNTELPYSNNATIVSLTNSDSVAIEEANYVARGTSFKYLASPYQCNMTIVYDAGWDAEDVPKRLKQAIMRDVAFHYENRNDKAGEIAPQAMVLASSFKRVSTWLQ